jgi:hypothetical protein
MVKYAMKTYERVEMGSSTPRPLYTRVKGSRYHWIGGWVDPRAGLDAVE